MQGTRIAESILYLRTLIGPWGGDSVVNEGPLLFDGMPLTFSPPRD